MLLGMLAERYECLAFKEWEGPHVQSSGEVDCGRWER